MKEVLYIVSDDNYVDIHLEVNGERKKEVFRSSLKNIESQIVKPTTPIYGCHRQYLININRFEVAQKNRRNMRISLLKNHDKIPVSLKYAEKESILKEMGADFVVATNSEDWQKQVTDYDVSG